MTRMRTVALAALTISAIMTAGCGSKSKPAPFDGGPGGAAGAAGTGGTAGTGGFGGTTPDGGAGGGAGVDGGLDAQGGAAGQGGEAGTAGTAGAGGAVNCPVGTGPAMLKLPGNYCADSTEVTRAQYAAWLATNPSPAALPLECAWKVPDGGVGGSGGGGNVGGAGGESGGASGGAGGTGLSNIFAPDPACMGFPHVCTTGCDSHPQVCVDWCDAWAYCNAAGKRLCGQIGGGSVDFNSYANSNVSQWYQACVSGDASNMYPYGNDYDFQSCNGWDNPQTGCMGAGACTTTPAGSLSSCQPAVAGYAGILDMSGNASEWEDSCSAATGASDTCHVRGGSFYDNAVTSMRCSSSGAVIRKSPTIYVGFRCCYP